MADFIDFDITERGKKRLEKLGEKFWAGIRLNHDEVLLLPLFSIYIADQKKPYARQLLDELVVELKQRFPDGIDDPELYIRMGYIKEKS